MVSELVFGNKEGIWYEETIKDVHKDRVIFEIRVFDSKNRSDKELQQIFASKYDYIKFERAVVEDRVWKLIYSIKRDVYEKLKILKELDSL